MKTALTIVIAIVVTVLVGSALNLFNRTDATPLFGLFAIAYLITSYIIGSLNSPQRQLRRRLTEHEKANYRHRGGYMYQGLICPKCGTQLTSGGIAAQAGWGVDASFDQQALKEGVLKCGQCGQQLEL